MVELLRKHRASIICGVVASLLVFYFPEPNLGLLGNFFVFLSSALGGANLNKIYAQATHLETQDYALIWLSSVALVLATPLLIVVIACVRIALEVQEPKMMLQLLRNPPRSKVGLNY